MGSAPPPDQARTDVPPLRVALIAGEVSGDLLGARLAQGLQRLAPSVELVGVCGAEMRAAGVTSWGDCAELSVMGLAEVLRHLPRLLRLRSQLRQRLLAWKPDLVIGIDAPDFNLGLERWLRQRGVRTAHYVSPSVWAWREKRASKIGHSADRVLCLFPMEPAIYQRYGVAAEFVGHPLAESFPLQPATTACRTRLGLATDGLWLGLLPGSRLSEVRRLGAVFIQAAALFRRRYPDFAVLVPLATAATRQAFELTLAELIAAAPASGTDALPSQAELIGLRDRLHLIDGQSHTVMQAADMLLLASGTAALEGMLAKKPLVVGYRIAALTHWLVKRWGLLKVSHYSLPNVLAGECLVPEYMQDACTPHNLCQGLLDWWQQPQRIANLLPRFESIHQSLLPASPNSAAEAALHTLAR